MLLRFAYGLALASAIVVAWESQAAAAGKFNKVLSVGDNAPQWGALPGIDDRQHSLSDYKRAKAVVVAFIANTCFSSRLYEDRIMALAKDYEKRGVQFVAISPSLAEGDLLPAMQDRAKEKGFKFPYVHDAAQKTARAYGASVTPQVFLLDGERKVAYMGAIDDYWQDAAKVKTPYLRLALDAVLAGKKPEVEETKAKGCTIEYVAPLEATATAAAPAPVAAEVSVEQVDKAGFEQWIAKQQGKVVLVDFWATWCPPCVKQFPHTVELAEKHGKQGLAVVSVSVDDKEDADKVREFLRAKRATFLNLQSTYGAADSIDVFELESGGPPNYWLYDRQGKLVKKFSSGDPTVEFKLEEVDRLVEKLLEEPAESSDAPAAGN